MLGSALKIMETISVTSLFATTAVIGGYNCSVNKSLADKVTAWYQVNDFRGRVLCLMGCYSHRLNLAVERLYRYEYSLIVSLL